MLAAVAGDSAKTAVPSMPLIIGKPCLTSKWRHNERDGVSNHQRLDVCSTVCSGADQREHQSSASLAFVRGTRQWPADSPHKGSLTRNCFHVMTSLCHPHSSKRCLWWLSPTWFVADQPDAELIRREPTHLTDTLGSNVFNIALHISGTLGNISKVSKYKQENT